MRFSIYPSAFGMKIKLRRRDWKSQVNKMQTQRDRMNCNYEPWIFKRIKCSNFLSAPTPKIFYSLKWIFAPAWNVLWPFSPSSNKSYHIIDFKTCEKPSIFCSWPSQQGSGSSTDLTSQIDLGVDPFPFWLCHEQKMPGFSQVLKDERRLHLPEVWLGLSSG